MKRLRDEKITNSPENKAHTYNKGRKTIHTKGKHEDKRIETQITRIYKIPAPIIIPVVMLATSENPTQSRI